MKIEYFLAFFWFLNQIRQILIWIFVWQKKEYHVGRFKAHFTTANGKKLIFNKRFYGKIFFLIFSRFSFIVFFGFLFYFLDAIYFIFQYWQKKLIAPVFTFKTKFLTFFSLILYLIFIFLIFKNFYSRAEIFIFLLMVDIFSPLLISLIVLIFQPFSFFWRYFFIQKAKMKRQKFKNLIAIGIVGSYGKSSTKEFLAKILATKFNVLKTEKNQNSEIGICQCILEKLNEKHEIFIAEMAAYNKGGIKLLSQIVKPKIGIVCGVNEQHLATFSSMENIISAEGGKEMIDQIPETGLVIFNGNNEICFKIYQETKKPKMIVFLNSNFSPKDKFDFLATDIQVQKDSLSFKVISQKETAMFKLNLLGLYNIENILLASATANFLGMSLAEISKAAQKIGQEISPVKLIKGKRGIDLILSTYSANPNSVLSHLEHLKMWLGKKIIIMPCLIELGKKAKEIHFKIGKKIGQICDLAIILTQDYLKEIKAGIIDEGKMDKMNLFFLENEKDILQKLKTSTFPDDVILVEGRISESLVEKIKEII